MKSTEPPPSYHHGNLRAEVLRVSEEEIAAGGLESLGLREVARRCGVSHAALFRHFSNREELVAAIAQEGFLELYRRLDVLPAAPSGQRLRLALLEYLSFSLERLGAYRAMFGGILRTLPETHGSVEASAKAFDWLVREIRDGQHESPSISAPPVQQALVVWSALHGASTLLSEFRVFPGGEPVTKELLAAWIGDQFWGPGGGPLGPAGHTFPT